MPLCVLTALVTVLQAWLPLQMYSAWTLGQHTLAAKCMHSPEVQVPFLCESDMMAEAKIDLQCIVNN